MRSRGWGPVALDRALGLRLPRVGPLRGLIYDLQKVVRYRVVAEKVGCELTRDAMSSSKLGQ